jgi:membrane-bound lytic murein transglycosylase MltF
MAVTVRFFLLLTILTVPTFAVVPCTAKQSRPVSSADAQEQARQLRVTNRPWRGDFDEIIERRLIRFLVPYSRTLYFSDKGRERGITADTVRDFERYINKKYAKQLSNRPITVIMIATTRDQLLPSLRQGLGDVAAGNLTVTEERLKLVDFVSPPDLRKVSEVVVGGPTSVPIGSTEELAGTTVHVRKSSSYYESLVALNARLVAQGKPPVQLVSVPEALEDEDMMEMLNTGLLQRMVVDDWMVKMWAPVLPHIKVSPVALRQDRSVGWALRQASPKLRGELEAFYTQFLKKQGIVAYRLKQYAARIKQIKDPTRDAEWKRFEQTLALFRKYGEQYGFDPLMLAAQGYQESQLDQSARSRAGAVGIMQLMPKTGAALKVGDITIAEPNVHAGAKYMDELMTKYFSKAHFSEEDRTLFAFASYNAGPRNIARLREEAQRRGLDANKWFNNVELVAAEKIGQETTTYVRNIYKYYAAYTLSLQAADRAGKARQEFDEKHR